jgi:hypothetical protein
MPSLQVIFHIQENTLSEQIVVLEANIAMELEVALNDI